MSYKNPKLLVIGYGRHGKDTVSEILERVYGLVMCSTSLWAAKHIMMPYFNEIGQPYDSIEECFNDRHTGNNRAVWFNQINAWGSEDLSRFSREVLVDHDIFVGMRNQKELQAARHLYDYVVWVDASGRGLPPEDKTSMTIVPDNEMIAIENNGSLEDLYDSVGVFAASIGLIPVRTALHAV